jgi:large subunit ribosomal protein L9
MLLISVVLRQSGGSYAPDWRGHPYVARRNGTVKILLTSDVEKLGKAGEIKDVSDGYARNFLIPKKFAIPANKGLIKQAQERLGAQDRRAAKERGGFEHLAGRINGQTLRFVVKIGEQERLYGSITNADIAERLQQQLGLEIDRRKIELEDPIKRAGVYSVSIRLAQGIEPRVNVVVEGEGGPVAVAAPAAAEAAEAAEAADDEALPEPE